MEEEERNLNTFLGQPMRSHGENSYNRGQERVDSLPKGTEIHRLPIGLLGGV